MENKIILTYVGTVKSSYSLDKKNDSIFSLGWVSGKNFIGELFV